MSVNIIILYFPDPEWDGEPLPPETCKVCNNDPCTCATEPAINQHYTEYHQQAFIDFILKRYVDEGVSELAVGKMKSMIELKYNTISDAAVEFGSARVIRDVYVGFQQYLYRD